MPTGAVTLNVVTPSASINAGSRSQCPLPVIPIVPLRGEGVAVPRPSVWQASLPVTNQQLALEATVIGDAKRLI
jgi:hypothetical protein